MLVTDGRRSQNSVQKGKKTKHTTVSETDTQLIVLLCFIV